MIRGGGTPSFTAFGVIPQSGEIVVLRPDGVNLTVMGRIR
jgi:hypothetical protein